MNQKNPFLGLLRTSNCAVGVPLPARENMSKTRQPPNRRIITSKKGTLGLAAQVNQLNDSIRYGCAEPCDPLMDSEQDLMKLVIPNQSGALPYSPSCAINSTPIDQQRTEHSLCLSHCCRIRRIVALWYSFPVSVRAFLISLTVFVTQVFFKLSRVAEVNHSDAASLQLWSLSVRSSLPPSSPRSLIFDLQQPSLSFSRYLCPGPGSFLSLPSSELFFPLNPLYALVSSALFTPLPPRLLPFLKAQPVPFIKAPSADSWSADFTCSGTVFHQTPPTLVSLIHCCSTCTNHSICNIPSSMARSEDCFHCADLQAELEEIRAQQSILDRKQTLMKGVLEEHDRQLKEQSLRLFEQDRINTEKYKAEIQLFMHKAASLEEQFRLLTNRCGHAEESITVLRYMMDKLNKEAASSSSSVKQENKEGNPEDSTARQIQHIMID